MIRRLSFVVLLVLVLAVATAHADAAPSPWFSEARGSIIKTVDLDSIGTGLSINVYRFTPERSLWADGCFLYDGSSNLIGGAGGLSTEVKGLPIIGGLPVDCAGLGVKLLDNSVTPMAYLTVHF